jgi:hypothetical protein
MVAEASAMSRRYKNLMRRDADRAITIDMNTDYTREARERLVSAPASFPMSVDDQADTLSSQAEQVSDAAAAD